ncbi:MAG: tetratricopeptide repeat protein [Candidatus Thorarchaeota archaeon]
MEPFGTITNFYPFLTENTRTIVETVLNEADGYDDFVNRLVDLVLFQKETNDLSYFTTIQAWLTVNLQIFDKLRDRILEDDVLRPWVYSLAFHGAQIKLDWDEVPSTLELALEKSPEDWVRVHLLMGGGKFAPVLIREKYLDEAEEIMERCPELKCFLPEVYIKRGWDFRDGGNFQGAISHFERAYKIAKEHNDIIRMADANIDLAGQLKESDVWLAIEKLEESYRNFKSVGAFAWAETTARTLGLFHTIIGEYDLAAEFYIEANRISEPSGHNKSASAVVLARLYCDIDLPEEALEWLNWKRDGEDITSEALRELPSTEHRFFVLAVARTMIQLGQLDDIPHLLNEAHKAVLQRGDEVGLINYNFVSGILELSLGNLEEGMQYIVDSLDEAERLKYEVYVNSALIALAKAEMLMIKESKRQGDLESSGPWMTRLGIHSREKNYPGIKMQHALLKAEYQTQIGETEAALMTLQDALTFTDSPGVKTLRQRILKKIDELETSINA